MQKLKTTWYDEFGVDPKFRHLENIDQGSTGACTLMALSHLMEMENIGLAQKKIATPNGQNTRKADGEWRSSTWKRS